MRKKFIFRTVFIIPVLTLLFSVNHPAFSAEQETVTAPVSASESGGAGDLETYTIPGGPPPAMLKDFEAMFPNEDFYEKPGEEILSKFSAQYPLWRLVIERIAADDVKREKAEEFFETHGFYPDEEPQTELPAGAYLVDYLYLEGNEPVLTLTYAELSEKIKAAVPAYAGGPVIPEVREAFQKLFADTSFGSWDPLFYSDYFGEDFSDEFDDDFFDTLDEDLADDEFADETPES